MAGWFGLMGFVTGSGFVVGFLVAEIVCEEEE